MQRVFESYIYSTHSQRAAYLIKIPLISRRYTHHCKLYWLPLIQAAIEALAVNYEKLEGLRLGYFLKLRGYTLMPGRAGEKIFILGSRQSIWRNTNSNFIAVLIDIIKA